MTFDRAADAVGNDRYAMFGAERYGQRNFFGVFRKDDAARQLGVMNGFIAAMLQAR
jgi:hypothetical protein